MNSSPNMNILLNSMNRAVMMDMAIRDIEEYMIQDRTSEISERDIDTLPILLEGDRECAVCLESQDRLHRLNCSHSFCKPCLANWLRIKNACPMCRATAITETETVRVEHVKRGLFLLRQLVYAMMCEDARTSLFSDNEEEEVEFNIDA